MIILPAIDIKDGNCVRLFKGDYATVQKVAESPYIAAQGFADAGAEWMHMVDLDGAKDAKLVNADLIADVAKASGLSDRKSTRLNSSHRSQSRMPSSA